MWNFMRAMNCRFLCFPRTQNVLGEKGRRIRELTAVVQKRFGFPEGSVEVSDLAYSVVTVDLEMALRVVLLKTLISLKTWFIHDH